MRVMGLHDLIYWLSHFTTAFVKMLVMMLIIAVLMCYLSFTSDGARITESSDVILIFILFIIYGCTAIWFAFVCATLMKNGLGRLYATFVTILL